MKNKNFYKMRKQRILPSLLSSILLPFILCVSVPFEMYCNNLSEFKFALTDFLPLCFVFFAISATVIFFILYLLPDIIYRIACAITVATSLMLFVQSAFLNKGLNTIAGDNMGTIPYTKGELLTNIAIWGIVEILFIAVAIFARKMDITHIIASVLCIALLGSQIISTAVLSINNTDAFLSITERNMSLDSSYQPCVLTN